MSPKWAIRSCLAVYKGLSDGEMKFLPLLPRNYSLMHYSPWTCSSYHDKPKKGTFVDSVTADAV